MLQCKVREASRINIRLQVQLVEVLSGKKMKIAIPDDKNPEPSVIESYEEDVSLFIYS